ncbi:uncharacterized protein LOC114876357 [Osmia bicornis bicornis]|uniref:uncharacterized protein LOC114876357 n=1 Tax=Osmia bicornis bicornis TaxID=1437191 RepID=UPI0010F8E7D3|nr:uncharacterized protein LOC114876357 [Osmia bicornis bicornis]
MLLHPKAYLSTPVIFPFSPRSCGILGASTAIHRIAENGEILSRIIPDDCCWFTAQSRCGVSRISDNVVNCTAFLDCSHHAREKEWFCQKNLMTHPSEVVRSRDNYESFANERNDEKYILIGTPSSSNRSNIPGTLYDNIDKEACKPATVKVEQDDSPKSSKQEGDV